MPCFSLAFLHLAHSVEHQALLLTDGLPNSSELFTFLLALVAWWRGCDDVLNEYVIVVSSIIILNTRHEIPRWWRPLASMGKSVDILWPNWQAHARGILPRWPPWLYWPSLGLIPGVSGKCQEFHPLFQNNYSWFWFSNKLFKHLKHLVSWVLWKNVGSKQSRLCFCILTEKQCIF